MSMAPTWMCILGSPRDADTACFPDKEARLLSSSLSFRVSRMGSTTSPPPPRRFGSRFSQVKHGSAPEWAHPAGIDFFHPVPDPDIRVAVAEIVSFVLGRRLMMVGSTFFDCDGWTVEENLVNPWGDGIRQLCQRPDVQPIEVQGHSDQVERLLADLVPKYLSVRKSLHLNDALWTYWLAKEAPPGANLAMFSAAVEALKGAWFRSTSTKSKGIYMEKAKFDSLTEDLLETLRRRLPDDASSKAILNKIAGSFQMGSNAQVAAFFDEIGLPIGKLEKDAMRARNGPAHNGVVTGVDLAVLVNHARAYRTLFERTFLRLIGYEGTYTDQTTLGFPRRPLTVPAGGS